jgi:DNA-binding NarL/FixJ family response regulator
MTEPAGSIRILLADDHAIVRSGVAQILNEERGMSVVAQAADGAEAVELYALHRPDVMLLDLRMPKLRRSPNILLIPSSSSVTHLRENLAAAELDLPDTALMALDGREGAAVRSHGRD